MASVPQRKQLASTPEPRLSKGKGTDPFDQSTRSLDGRESRWARAILRPGGPLKWKMRLVKDARLSLPLTEVMKIARFTSQLPDVLRLSLPRLGHGSRLLFRTNQTLNLYTLLFAMLLALLPHLSPLLTSQNVPHPESRIRSLPTT